MRVSPKSLLLASTFAALVAAPCLLVAGDAAAQSSGLTPYPPCTIKPTAQDVEAAHSAYLLGKRFFEESDYGSASHNFIDAYKLDCSKPELLLNIARANELLGNRAEAIHALETYLERGTSLGLDDRTQLQRRIDNLKAALAAQQPPTPQATAPVVAPPVAPPPPTTPAPPPPLPPPDEERHHTALPWIVTGIGGVSAIVGGVMYLVGSGDVSSAENGCKMQGNMYTCAPNVASKGNTGDTLEGVGAGFFWGGLAVAGAGVLWHFLEPTGPAKPESKASFTPLVGPGFAGGSLSGAF